MTGKRFLQLVAVAAGLGILAAALGLGWALRPRPAVAVEIGEPRAFGGFDAHLEVAVIAVEEHQTWGPAPELYEPRGRLLRITVEAANTAASDTFFVDPTRLRVRIRSATGREWPPLSLVGSDGAPARTSFATEIGNGERVRQDFLFDVSDDAERPMIWISRTSRLSRLFPTFEESILQPKLVVPLPGRSSDSASSAR